jgi:hypothetical protein
MLRHPGEGTREQLAVVIAAFFISWIDRVSSTDSPLDWERGIMRCPSAPTGPRDQCSLTSRRVPRAARLDRSAGSSPYSPDLCDEVSDFHTRLSRADR